MPRVAASLLVAALVACSAAPATNDASVDGGGDAALDAGIDGEVDARVDAGLPSPRPLAPRADPTPLAATWWASYTVHAVPDPVLTAIESGTFVVPTAEASFDGIDWVAWDPGTSHQFPAIGDNVAWAATTLVAPPGQGVIVRADQAISVHLGTQRQPGDPYGSGKMRVPVVLGRSDALAVRVYGGRGVPLVQAWTTPDELWLNTDDVTVPDLVVGERDVQWIGISTLNLTDHPALDATARVVGDANFEETVTAHPALPAGAVTNVAFRLVPRTAFAAPADALSVTLRIESDSMAWSYEREVSLKVVARGEPFRRTFLSAIDGSAQYFAVRPPLDHDRTMPSALVLALHGASVEAIGMAQSYSPHDGHWIVAATNRRPFGFDWEAWGRLDALEVLEEARRTFATDPTRVYVTGHSMGGHGTWQLGSLFPGRFAVVGPSSGWASFYTYTGRARPTGAFAQSMASSDTPHYAANLARRSVYVIHGSADTNVPVREARDMVALLTPIVPALQYHEEPGADHWWDGTASPGVDCVDWPPLFDTIAAARLDPSELDFDFLSPSPSVSPSHSYATIRAALDPLHDVRIVSAATAPDTVTLTTTNVRGMVLDGDALGARGVAQVVADGTSVAVVPGPLPVGPQDGKRPDVYGPFDQVLARPFCFAYPDGRPALADYAAFLASTWSLIGNGASCALPASRLSDGLYAARDVVWIGEVGAGARWDGTLPITTGARVGVGTTTFPHAVLAFVYPQSDGSRLGGGILVTPGDEQLLYRFQPFTSSFAAPDYLVLTATGTASAGFFDATWSLP